MAKSGNNTSRKPNGRAAPPEAHEPAVELPAVAGLIEGCKKAGLVIDEEIAKRTLLKMGKMPLLPRSIKRLGDRVARGERGETTLFTPAMLPGFMAREREEWLADPARLRAVEEDARAQRVARADLVDRIADLLRRAQSPTEEYRSEVASNLRQYHDSEPEAYAEAVKKAGM